MRVITLACCLAVASLGTAAAQSTSTSTAATTTSAVKAKPKGSGGGAARTIELTAGDTMKYDKTELTARPGESLHVVVKNVGAMPKLAMGHNFVLVKAGTDVAAFNTAAMNARETDFIPPSMKDAVIANTPISGPGESVETTFKAPAKPGTYTFFCSFPGHFNLGMRGTLTVK